MIKKQSISLLLKQFLSILFIVITVVGYAYADVLECEIGDTSKGNWVYVSDECLYPGPPAEDSPWPTDSDLLTNGPAYRIEGRYKISASIMTDGYSPSQPPERPKCITGLAETYAAYDCARQQNQCVASGGCSGLFTAEGTICTMRYLIDPPYSPNPLYVRYYDNSIMLYEWKCNPQSPKPSVNSANLGPTCPSS